MTQSTLSPALAVREMKYQADHMKLLRKSKIALDSIIETSSSQAKPSKDAIRSG